MNAANAWLFNCNPKRFDAEGALRAKVLGGWSVQNHKRLIKPGDTGYFWICGEDASLLGSATIADRPSNRTWKGDEKYVIDKKAFKVQYFGVGFIDIRIFPKPIKKSVLAKYAKQKEYLALRNFFPVKIKRLRNTNYAITKEEWSALERLIQHHCGGPSKEPDMDLADNAETAARNEISRGAIREGLRLLAEAKLIDFTRQQRLNDEFGFLTTSSGSHGNPPSEFGLASESVPWCRFLWRAIADRNRFPFPHLGSQDNLPEREEQQSKTVPDAVAPIIKFHKGTSEQKGDQLERAVARLFHVFFQWGEEQPQKIRQQKRGTQGGYDLSVEWDRWSGKYQVAGNASVRCHIECKNYKDPITPNQVAEKLMMEPKRPPVIDHWILISPHADPSNPLNDFLEKQRNEEAFPFEVQIWSPNTLVYEFFGLEPDVYDLFFQPKKGELHPRDWNTAKREEIRAKWRKRLDPPLRLPSGWKEYLQDPDKLCIHQEIPAALAQTFPTRIRMSCRNAAGVVLEKPLDDCIDDWLASPQHKVLFLLGEFGDGKTFFTYVLARRLSERWLLDPTRRCLPLRLALRRFPGKARDFLRERLEVFGADIGGWEAMGKICSRLIILDGFDEMSIELDPATVTANIKALLSCIEEFTQFHNCKVLVTSRTHFFENRKDAQRLLTRAGSAQTYYLAPIGRNQVIKSVADSVSNEEAQKMVRRLQTMNDPVGLATKPLFLEMLKQLVNSTELPCELDTVSLYEWYINRSLNRKSELLNDPELSLTPEETVKNLRMVLGEIAEELQCEGRGYVSLSKFKASRPLAQLLWSLSGFDDDARNRIGTRSLLGRVIVEGSKEEWPVDFCHRSMREYFVARQLCGAVERGPTYGKNFLKRVPLNHEILGFAAEYWRKASTPGVKEQLLRIITSALGSAQPGRLGGNALTLLYQLEPKLPRSFDWTGKVFDGADLENADLSGLDLSRSSFKYANLANANLENTNLEHCDLTGVRIEETAAVLAIGRDLSEERLIAAYRDGVLREWHLKPAGKTPAKVIGKVHLSQPCSVGIHRSGQQWLLNGSEFGFFRSGENGFWERIARFKTKGSLYSIKPEENLLAFINKNPESRESAVIVDLPRQVELCSILTNGSLLCVALGNEAIVWSEAAVGFRAKSIGTNPGQELILECDKEPSCIDAYKIDSKEYLVAGGTGDGFVVVWRVTLVNGRLTQQKILNAKAHEGLVTCVCFVDSMRVSSGGKDCAIIVTRWEEGRDISGQVERRLQLKFRCSGLRIRGLKSAVERELLSKLIEQTKVTQ